MKKTPLFLLLFVFLSIGVCASDIYTFDDEEARMFLGFMYDRSEDKMKAANLSEDTSYKLLTGKYEDGSDEETVAQIAFLSTLYEYINQSIQDSSNTFDASSSRVLEYLKSQVPDDIAGEEANKIFRNILVAVTKCVLIDISISNEFLALDIENAYNAVVSATSIEDKAMAYVDKIEAFILSGVAIASGDKYLMYNFFKQCVQQYAADYDDEYKEWLLDAELISTIGKCYDPFLNWRDEEKVDTIKRWARYVAAVEKDVLAKSTSSSGDSGDNGNTGDSGTSGGTGSSTSASYTITFVSNCSTVANYSYTYYTSQRNWQQPSFTRRGYLFEGWYWDEACTNKAEGTITINKDLTFYAKWAKQFSYTVSNGEISITGLLCYPVYDGVTDKNIIIPQTIDGYNVTSIADNAFKNTTITGITIEKGVKSIGSNAFNGCIYMKFIWLPPSINTIGGSAFTGCTALNSVNIIDLAAWCNIDFEGAAANPLYCGGNFYIDDILYEDLTIPKSITTIKPFAFSGGAFECISIPSSIKTIGTRAFFGSGAKNFIIPEGIVDIEELSFAECSNVKRIVFPEGLTNIGVKAFAFCASLEEVIFPSTLTNICDSAFSECNEMVEITIPNSVTTLGKAVFYDCENLKNVILSNNLEVIDQEIFHGCSNLSDLIIPDSVTKIFGSAFDRCGNFNLTIGKNVSDIEELILVGCHFLVNDENPYYSSDNDGNLYNKDKSELLRFTRNIEGNAFYEVPFGVKKIGAGAFYAVSLETVELPESVTEIGGSAFTYSRLKNINIPESVTIIGDGAFAYSNLSSIDLPNSITRIGDSVFNSCCLSSIDIPDSVTSIGDSAFYFCPFNESLTIPDSVTSIGDSAFYLCDYLKSVTIGKNVTSIGEKAFDRCDDLNSVTLLGKGTISIGDNAFDRGSYITIYGYLSSYAETFAAENNNTFKVIPHTLKAKETDGVYTIDMSYGDTLTGTLAAALYDETGKFIEIQFLDVADAVTVDFQKDVESGNVKFMWLNDLSTFAPLCENLSLEVSPASA